MSSGSVATFCSDTTLPASSTTHTAVSFTDTSRPTKCAIAAVPSLVLEFTSDLQSTLRERAASHHIARNRRDTPSMGGGCVKTFRRIRNEQHTNRYERSVVSFESRAAPT